MIDIRCVVMMMAFTATPALAAEPMTAKLRDDGTLLVNDKPVLPYGFYISTGHTAELRLKCVEEIARIGGTVVHVEGPWPDDTRFLDRAAELGLWVVAGHVNTEEKLDRVRKFKNHPAIIAWTLFDDANTLSTVPHLKAMNALVKEIVPHRLSYIPMGTQSRTVPMPKADFFACADFVGWEMYPVANPRAAASNLNATEEQCVRVRELARKAKRPFWILPQAFAWPGQRAPTPEEYRNLCYVGLINGAKGVMPWSIYHQVDSPKVRAEKKARKEAAWEEWSLPENKELWAECEAVAKELKTCAPLLLEGTWSKLPTGGDVTAAMWLGETEALVVVANLSEDSSSQVRIEFSAKLDAKWKPEFREAKAGWTMADGKLTGSIAARAVHVGRVPLKK